jgi:4-oxalocrotonate tautomerase
MNHALVDIQLPEGAFTQDQKAEMITKVTDVMVGIEGEAPRSATWVRVLEAPSGQWAIGGTPLNADAIKDALQKKG